MQRRPGNEEVKSKQKLAFRPAFEINDKLPKGQLAGAVSYNEMRQWIIDHGGMEER